MNDSEYSQPLLSIVIPTRHRPQSMLRCVHSLSDHTVRPGIAIVVVVDGNEYSSNVLSELHDTEGVTVLQTNHAGPAAARNHGVQAVQSKFVCFLDDDCVAPAGFINQWMTKVRELPPCTVAIGGSIKPLAHVSRTIAGKYLDASRHLDGPLTANGVIVNLASGHLCVRREAFLQCGGFDERFSWAGGEDQHLVMKLTKIGDVIFIERIHILHDNNISLLAFVNKFFRYGRGVALTDALLDNSTSLDVSYIPITVPYYSLLRMVREYQIRVNLNLKRINVHEITNTYRLLALLQEISFQQGYAFQRAGKVL